MEAGIASEQVDGVAVAHTPASIISGLDACFERAHSNGDVLFFPSTVHRHEEGGVDVRPLHLSYLSI